MNDQAILTKDGGVPLRRRPTVFMVGLLNPISGLCESPMIVCETSDQAHYWKEYYEKNYFPPHEFQVYETPFVKVSEGSDLKDYMNGHPRRTNYPPDISI